MEIENLSTLIVARDNPPSMIHAARTAVAAVASYLIAQSFRLPQAYWAAISTLIVMQATLGGALPISLQRFAGTAIGAAAGAAGACQSAHLGNCRSLVRSLRCNGKASWCYRSFMLSQRKG